jgi:glycosyltransferase involved in cell wall biosynthesis
MATSEKSAMSDCIYIFSPAQFFGGGEVYQIRLANLLDLRQRFTVISPASPSLQRGLAKYDSSFIELTGQSGVAVRLDFLSWLHRSRSMLRKEAATIVLNGRGAAYFAPAVKIITGIRPVVIYHTALSTKRYSAKELMYRMALYFAKATVAVSETVALQHRQRWPNLQVYAIPNWIESTLPSATAPAMRNTLIDVAVVGRLEESKGVLDVVTICSSGDSPDIHFYGDGPLRENLEVMSKRLPAVKVHGHVDDLWQQLSQHAILLSASYSESFSYSVAEGIYAGLLCVVSDIPAHRELLGPDYPDALYFVAGDRAGLRAALATAHDYVRRNDGSAVDIIGLAKARMDRRNGAEQARKEYRAVLLDAS